MEDSHLFSEAEWDAAPLDESEELADAAPAVPFAPMDDAEIAALEQTFAPHEGPGRIQLLMEDVVRTSGMEAHLRKAGDQDLSELKNVEELISAAAEFDAENPRANLYDYLAQVSLVSDVDHLGSGGGSVTLMTLHAAKGLEFPVVAIIGIEDGILPHSRARDNLDELEEERRLLFVGITRARQRLILSRAQVRTVRGMRERTIPSPFLSELPEDQLTISDRTGLGFAGDDDDENEDEDDRRRSSARDAARSYAGFRRGQMVRHPTFGVGRIADLSDSGSNTRAVIEFSRAGRKTLILEYARLEPVA